MSSPYEDLIAALNLLKNSLSVPAEMMKLAAEAEELQEAMEARHAIQTAIGQIPIPADHPDFIAVAGAMGEAGGAIDNVNQAYQVVRQESRSAQAAIQNVSYVIDSVIMGLQQGHS